MEISKPNLQEGGLSQSLLSGPGSRHNHGAPQEMIKFPKFKKPWTPVGQRSCLVTKGMRKQHRLHKQLSPLVQRMLNSYSDGNANNDKNECQGNAKSKVTWCASSSKKSNYKVDCGDATNKLPKTTCPHTRGKWVIQPDHTSSKVLDQIWLKLCRISKKGGLPQCNCKLKEGDGAVWVYCYALQAKMVFKVLRTEILLQQAKFYVQGQCLLQADDVDITELNYAASDR